MTEITLDTVGLNLLKVQSDIYFISYNFISHISVTYIFRFEKQFSENPLNYVSIGEFSQFQFKKDCVSLYLTEATIP